jgi:hypothetical protein
VAARERGRVAALIEQEADVADNERHRGGERPQRGGDRAGAGELAEHVLRVGRAEQDRRPAGTAHEPPLEQLANGAVAGGTRADEPEQRPRVTVGGKAQVEAAAE